MREANGIKQLPTGRYQARYRFAPGARGTRTASFDTRREAKAWVVTQEAALATGVGIDPRHGRVVLGDYFADWLERQWHLAPTTRHVYETTWATRLAPTFGPLRLRDINAAHRPALAGRHAAPPGPLVGRDDPDPAVAGHERRRRRGPDRREPRGAGAPPDRAPRGRAPPTRHPSAPCSTMRPAHLVVALHLALEAGLRSGELRGLTTDRVDFSTGLLTIDRQLLRLPPGHVFADGEWHHGRDAFGAAQGRHDRAPSPSARTSSPPSRTTCAGTVPAPTGSSSPAGGARP